MSQNKKAQTSEIFFFILAIVIIGLLLLFGVKYIMELGSKVNQIELVQFKTDVENYADEYRPVFGKWKKLTISVPVGILKVCFVQHETFTDKKLDIAHEEGLCKKDNEDYNLFMCNAWQDDISRNVYTNPFDELEVGIDLGAIEVGTADQNYLCIDTSDHILQIKMTGKGDRVLIEEWS